MNEKNNKDLFTKQDYELIKREVVWSGVFTLSLYHLRHRLFNGGWSEVFTREVLERTSASAILPYDPVMDHVILIEQFRPGSLNHPESPWLIEIPAGILSKNNTYTEVAIQEAEEEAGCKVTELYPIHEVFVSPGGSNEYLHIYCGKIDARGVDGIHGLKHEHEDIRVINLPFDQAIQKLQNNEIKTIPAIIALQWLQLNRNKLQTLWT